MPTKTSSPYITQYREVKKKQINLVGGKNLSCAFLSQQVDQLQIQVPSGFIVNTRAYDAFLTRDLQQEIDRLIEKINYQNLDELQSRAGQIQALIKQAEIPQDLKKDIKASYLTLSKKFDSSEIDVAVRSSATAEDLDNASFAGQQDSYLNISSPDQLLEACKKCYASLYNARAISYRKKMGFAEDQVKLAIGVQKMIRSDLGASGVMFTVDTESGCPNVIRINGSFGLGEAVVKGEVIPDEFLVSKPSLSQQKKAIIYKKLGDKQVKYVYTNSKSDEAIKKVKLDAPEQTELCLNEEQVLELAKQGKAIEDAYQKPMDIEWALDGQNHKLYIIQARPETVHSRKSSVYREYSLQEESEVLVTGFNLGNKIATGEVQVIENLSEGDKFKKGNILVTETTDPNWEPIMNQASAMITDQGGRSCHAAIVSRELGIPAVVGTGNATQVFKSGQELTIDCSEGEIGRVWAGKLKFKVEETDLTDLKKPPVDITVLVGNPHKAMQYSYMPVDAVGVARLEFIINTYIGIHPLALVNYDQLQDKEAKQLIAEKTKNFSDKKEFYIHKLVEAISQVATAFYPRQVTVRHGDFKSNEYANLLGGREFEPEETNPMLGIRGAARFYSKTFQPAFELECEAIRRAREDMGLDNIQVMIPFCRTIEEGRKVMKIQEKFGLIRGKNGLKLYFMCELPANIILIDKFLDLFDGFVIGSNDLSQLVLGIDRDAGSLNYIGDERHPAVKTLITRLIKAAHKKSKRVALAGQGPSDFPDYAEFLMEQGIDELALTPDAVMKVLKRLSR